MPSRIKKLDYLQEMLLANQPSKASFHHEILDLSLSERLSSSHICMRTGKTYGMYCDQFFFCRFSFESRPFLITSLRSGLLFRMALSRGSVSFFCRFEPELGLFPPPLPELVDDGSGIVWELGNGVVRTSGLIILRRARGVDLFLYRYFWVPLT